MSTLTMAPMPAITGRLVDPMHLLLIKIPKISSTWWYIYIDPKIIIEELR